MSAEKPEVGDVFEDKQGKKFFIYEQYPSFYEAIFKFQGKTRTVMLYEHHLNKMFYLGKSKVNINDLFEVNDD